MHFEEHCPSHQYYVVAELQPDLVLPVPVQRGGGGAGGEVRHLGHLGHGRDQHRAQPRLQGGRRVPALLQRRGPRLPLHRHQPVGARPAAPGPRHAHRAGGLPERPQDGGRGSRHLQPGAGRVPADRWAELLQADCRYTELCVQEP